MVIKKKYSKKGSIAFAAALLSGVAITSAVFAGWIIINGDTKTAGGTINVDKVEEENHEITLPTGYTGSIMFGAKKAGVTGPSWLKVSTGANEKLTETLTFTVSNCGDETYNTLGNLFNLELLTLEEKDGGTKYSSAVTGGYVGELPTLANGGITLAQDGETTAEGVRTFNLSIEFKWGIKFGGDNPTKYAAETLGESATAEAKEAFQTDLTNLYNAVNGINYTLTIVTK